jgi:serine/threonine protein kinase/class 3 adenylate cyclase
MAELKTFVFTDISGSVRLKDEMVGRSVTERDQAFISSILTPHRQRIEAHLGEFGGRVVSTAGDGHFLVFDHTIQAAQWAISVQESHRDDPIITPAGEHVEVRMSMHVGVPQIDPGDPDNFVGKTVDYAARLNDYATGGQILVSRSVMAILEDVGLEGVKLHMHGRRSLKGIGNVEVHELLYDDHGPRPMRNQPKHEDRQWTVIPTQLGETAGQGGVTTAGATKLKRVGNYELDEIIGSGGMGDVYKAHHLQFGRVRAVKVIKPQFVASGHDEVFRRFYNEIKAVGRLEHKNIVVAIDSSSPTDQVHYLVMEYIPGVGLDELVGRHGPLPIAEACEIIRQAARGLQYIHKHGMVHRDIKPSNLMVTLVEGESLPADSSLTEQGEVERAVVKILDLGLALLAVDNSDRLTRFDHKAMGTGMYMPPEQWKTTSVDIRADIYSMGCTLYHLLAGNPPYYDSDLRPEKAHEKAPLPPIRNSLQPVPKKLWDVLHKMLEKRPEDRYATPAEVAAALAPFAEGHDLAGLIKRYDSAETVTDALTPTKPNGISKIDTRKSKPRYYGEHFAPSRRWVLTKLLPVGLLAVFVAGAFWLLREGYRHQQEQRARTDLPAFARIAATGSLNKEISTRFAKLSELATDPVLIAALRAHNQAREQEFAGEPLPDKLPASRIESLKSLDDWIGKLGHITGLSAESWFVNDNMGYQVARSPVSDSVGQRYHTRDYFHGLGRSLKASDPEPRPISRPHLSTVYQSDTSSKYKVAFSVPIFDLPSPTTSKAERAAPGESAPGLSEPDDPQVIGVLAMSVNLADFEVLDPEQQGGNEVVLVDLRPDELDGKLQAGLILHHPKQERGERMRIDGELLDAILAARPFSKDFRREQTFISGYVDPFDPGKLYWGAFQPVALSALEAQDVDAGSGDEIPAERGWIVIVQRPMYD